MKVNSVQGPAAQEITLGSGKVLSCLLGPEEDPQGSRVAVEWK